MTSALKSKPAPPLLEGYAPESFFDEMVSNEGEIRPHYAKFAELFQATTREDFDNKRQAVDLAFMRQGVTFNVYGDSQGAERIFPFDLSELGVSRDGVTAPKQAPFAVVLGCADARVPTRPGRSSTNARRRTCPTAPAAEIQPAPPSQLFAAGKPATSA